MAIVFEVWCGECGAPLCYQTEVDDDQVHVMPCRRCLEGAQHQGHKDGFEEGKEEGRHEGYDEGYADREDEEDA